MTATEARSRGARPREGAGTCRARSARTSSRTRRIRAVVPKVYLWFLPDTNALALRVKDPDGLLDPNKGIDLATVKVLADGTQDILPWLWPFLSSAHITPDGTDATLEFGKLPIPRGLKVRLEVQACDRTGLHAWDWQITPPGVAPIP